MRDLEPMIRDFTVSTLDKLVGREEIDIIADIGAEIPMRVIGALLGIPEEDLQAIRHSADERIVTEEGICYPPFTKSLAEAVDKAAKRVEENRKARGK